MRFTVSQKQLAEMISVAAKIPEKSTVKVLECIRLAFSQDGISVSTTNIDSWMTVSTPNFGHESSTVAIVPCRGFHSIVSGIPKDQEITLSVTEKRLTIITKTSKYTFGTVDPQEWPEIPWNEKAE